MIFGGASPASPSKEEAKRIFEAFLAAGGNFVDTANCYARGASESIVGELAAGRRAELVLATKYSLTSRPRDANGGGNHRKNLVQSLEESLRRLGTDYVDLYWVHAPDFVTPVEEIMRALDDVVRAGKVLYVGISDAPAWLVAQANTLAEFRGWTRFVGLQVPYSLAERTVERELLPMARALDIAVTTWGALGAGALTGKYESGKSHPEGQRLSSSVIAERTLGLGQLVKEIATEIGVPPAQVALAWILAQRERVNIIPIVGARNVAQIEDNLGALSLALPEESLARLDDASRIELGFPYDFLARARQVVFGETSSQLDDHRA
jgi:aryl-alcohol dehydrogenase-like predicted oxidoreductase